MSERGTFVTNYIYCSKCYDVARKILEPLCDRAELGFKIIAKPPIIVGEIGGLYPGEELDVFESEFLPELEKELCHEMRIAVLAETGERIFTIVPKINGLPA